MNQVSKNSGGHLGKHLTKLCVPCFVLLSPFTVQKVRWRQRLTVDWRQLPRKKIETRQRQVAVCGSGRKHAISCHWSPIRMYPNEAWDSSGSFLNGTSGDGVALRWRGRETEEGAASTGHSQEAHPGACLWSGPLGSSRRRSGADGRLQKVHGSHSFWLCS